MAKRTYKRKKQKTKIIYTLLGAFLTLVVLFGYTFIKEGEASLEKVYETLGLTNGTAVAIDEGEMAVHFIDVEQGDSILIQAPNHTILIDGGDNDKGDILLKYLHKQRVEAIDLIIATHPHADHIGGLDKIIDTFSVKQIMMPKVPDKLVPTSKTYEDLLLAIQNKGLKISVPDVGQQYSFDGGKLVFVGPVKKSYSSLNNHSISVHLQYGDRSFLFMGDTEQEGEKDILESGSRLKAVVLKAGHHGSNTSTTQEFLDRVDPKYVVISCGVGNKYNHPGNHTVNRVKKKNAEVLRTDLHGSVVFTTDGKALQCTREKG